MSDVTSAADGHEVVAHEQDRKALRSDISDLLEAASLELLVTDGEHFVDDQDLRLEMRGDGERRAAPACRWSSA